ncbi:MAG: hypothetical protein IT455_01770 [Planctomycetes bacterium]|nr:hypothetical protein [Planctomycetota bacterium]
MRRIIWLGAAVALAVAAWMVIPDPPILPIDARLIEARAGAKTRLDPPPIASFSTVTFVIDAPESIRALAVDHVAYGELRVAPNGPYFFLSGNDPSDARSGRIKCEVELALDGAQGVTADDLRAMLDLGEVLAVQLRIFDGSRVVAESSWMDASDLLASVAEQLR